MLEYASEGSDAVRERIEVRGVPYRSAGEAELARILHLLEVDFEYETLAVSYVHPDGSSRTYVPDFYLPDTQEVLEVKGDDFNAAVVAAKLKAVRDRGLSARVLTRQEILGFAS